MSSTVAELPFAFTFMADKPLVLDTCYLLIFCTRNCEYHSWVYFVNFLQTPECHSYLYTRESNHFYPFLYMFSLSQTKIIMLNFEKSKFIFSCTVTFVLLNLFSTCRKNAMFVNLTNSNLFFLHPYMVCYNFSI